MRSGFPLFAFGQRQIFVTRDEIESGMIGWGNTRVGLTAGRRCDRMGTLPESKVE